MFYYIFRKSSYIYSSTKNAVIKIIAAKPDINDKKVNQRLIPVIVVIEAIKADINDNKRVIIPPIKYCFLINIYYLAFYKHR